MEAYFKQENGKLTLQIDARSNIERATLEEFMQQEIPGYKHSFHYNYDGDKLKVHFRPIIGINNLIKEGFYYMQSPINPSTGNKFRNEFNLRLGFFLVREFGNCVVIINTFGSIWHVRPLNSLIHKRVKDIKELRSYVKENENIWKSYQY